VYRSIWSLELCENIWIWRSK